MQATANSLKSSEATGVYAFAKLVYDKMLLLYDRIIKNRPICDVIDQEIHMPQPSGKDVDLQYKIVLVFCIDLIKCYQNMGHKIDFNERDSYLIPMAANIKVGADISTETLYDEYVALFEVKYLYTGIVSSFEPWVKQDGPEFLFTRFTNDINPTICSEYIDLMIMASRYIGAANPTNNNKEDAWIKKLSR